MLVLPHPHVAVTDGSFLVPHTILLEPEALKFLFLLVLALLQSTQQKWCERERVCMLGSTVERLTETTSKIVRVCVSERECVSLSEEEKIGDRG